MIIRGPSGCGKSTLAKKLMGDSSIARHFEADMFFHKDGVYQFDASLLKQAHEWCKSETEKAMLDSSVELVIVSNTFIKFWEVEHYLNLFEKIEQVKTVEFMYPTEGTGNIHGVPQAVVQRMRDSFEEIPAKEMQWIRIESARRLAAG